jgi:hypothetical protein
VLITHYYKSILITHNVSVKYKTNRYTNKNKLANEFIGLIDKYSYEQWNCMDWYNISSNPNITIEIIENHPDKPWDWRGVSSNSNITMDIIEKHFDKPWN